MKAERLVGVVVLALGVTFGAYDIVDAQQANEAPGAPRFFSLSSTESNGDVGMRWRRSTDDTGIASYDLLRNGQLWQSFPDAVTRPPQNGFYDGDERLLTVSDLPAGTSFLQLVAVDLDGVVSVRTPPQRVFIDRTPPSAPRNVTATTFESPTGPVVEIRYEMIDDPEDIVCRLLRNLGGTYFDSYPASDARQPDGSYLRRDGEELYGEGFSLSGTWWYQLQCFDRYGNASVRSAPAQVVIP